MTKTDIEWLIVELLAQDAGVDPADLWEELSGLGADMPVDSLLAAEVLARVQQQVGVELPTTAETARALQSVKTFAAAVHELLTAIEGGNGSQAATA